ncbi:STAS domain-containing protein, partial [Candidatus Sumerlaeota bacterium]|nr:STAS domain-containing protein [Candidatus Sumerlaeota bacterium]
MERAPVSDGEGLAYQLLRVDNRVVFAALQGHIRLAEAGTLRDLMQALGQHPAEAFYLDLTGIQYIDSTGLGLLMALHKQIHEAGGRLHLLQPARTVLSVLRLSKLDRVFHLVSEEDASDLRSQLL